MLVSSHWLLRPLEKLMLLKCADRVLMTVRLWKLIKYVDTFVMPNGRCLGLAISCLEIFRDYRQTTLMIIAIGHIIRIFQPRVAARFPMPKHFDAGSVAVDRFLQLRQGLTYCQNHPQFSQAGGRRVYLHL